MKALPKRKGNANGHSYRRRRSAASMKALPKRKGNKRLWCFPAMHTGASMKALPKRKGNVCEVSVVNILVLEPQ